MNDFKVVPLYYDTSLEPHYLFLKEHQTRIQDSTKPAGRTLFVLNIPPYVNQDVLQKIFQNNQLHVQNVQLQKSADAKNGFQSAFLVFSTRDRMLKACNVTKLEYSLSSTNLITGLRYWTNRYNSLIQNRNELEETVKDVIQEYDILQKSKKATNEIDLDGWTTIPRRHHATKLKESVHNKIKEKAIARKKKTELKNFYTFQIKEQKMKSIIALRKSFQESKEKLNTLKKMRTFKPF